MVLGLFLRIDTSGQEHRNVPLTQKLRQMDPLGTFLFMGLISCFVLALQWGGLTHPWNSPTIIGLFVVFGVVTIIFCFVEYRLGENALIPYRILRVRSIYVGSLFLIFLGMVNYTVRDILLSGVESTDKY